MSCTTKLDAPETSRGNLNPYSGLEYTSKYHDLLEKRKNLAVWKYKNEFMELLEKYQTIIVVGGPGSGKTTQIPQWCVEYNRSLGSCLAVACTQPRRQAAVSAAQHVSEEMDVGLGNEVGYTIKFEDRSSQKTVLKYMTDGNMLREVMDSHMLDKYQVIILDEAHEKTLQTDTLVDALKEVAKQRKELKLVIMTDTLDPEKFQVKISDMDQVHIMDISRNAK